MRSKGFKFLLLLCIGWTATDSCVAWAGNSVEDKVLQTLRDYVEADIRYDAQAVIDSSHPALLDARGGRQQMLEMKEAQYRVAPRYRLVPDRVVLGEPRLHRTGVQLIARVPVLSVTKGFPANVENRGSFVLISTDDGETWYVVDNSCAGQSEARKVFPDLLEWNPDVASRGPFEPKVIVRGSEVSFP